jgi:lysophospholipase L1-like esterase
MRLYKISTFVSALAFCVAIHAQPNTFKFDFGNGKAETGYTKVTADMVYSKEKGYGFDFQTEGNVKNFKSKGKDALTSDCVMSDKPFYFSVYLPEGNYNIKIIFGNAKDSALTTMRLESRRLLVERLATAPGQFETREFTVNMRVPLIAGTKDSVKLKQREWTKLDWDDKLTFEFNDKKPSICALEITPVTDAITIFLAGNSTVVDQDDEPWASWGQMFPKYFKKGVAISNHAESGLTLGSFLSSKRLDKVLSMMKAGDYLFIEFGHNDQKEKGPNDGAYKSYTERFKRFIDEVRKKGGTPVIVTSTNRRSFGPDGKVFNSLGDYPDAARKVAMEEKVAIIDLNAMTKVFYEALGPDRSKKAFVIYPANSFPGQTKDFNDNTHFNGYGAYELAKCIVQGIRNNHIDIEKYLIDGIPFFDAGAPDNPDTFYLPLAPRSSVVKPDGN